MAPGEQSPANLLVRTDGIFKQRLQQRIVLPLLSTTCLVRAAALEHLQHMPWRGGAHQPLPERWRRCMGGPVGTAAALHQPDFEQVFCRAEANVAAEHPLQLPPRQAVCLVEIRERFGGCKMGFQARG